MEGPGHQQPAGPQGRHEAEGVATPGAHQGPCAGRACFPAGEPFLCTPPPTMESDIRGPWGGQVVWQRDALDAESQGGASSSLAPD